MNLPKPTTPRIVSKEITKFCKMVNKAAKPLFVPVQPVPGFRANFCWNNVQEHVRRHGGHLEYGWIIWEMPGLLVEAEFHGIWVSPAGEKIDVTEKEDNEEVILFLPDTTREFKGKLIENIRYPLVDNVVTRRIINRNKALAALKSKYYNDKTGVSEMPVDELMAIGERFRFL